MKRPFLLLEAMATLAVLCTVAAIMFGCRTCPTCPVAVPPPPVTVPAPKIPCALPTKPVPPDLEHHVGAYDATHALIDGSTLKELGVYVLAVEARDKAATDCLSVSAPIGKVVTIPHEPPGKGSGSGSAGAAP